MNVGPTNSAQAETLRAAMRARHAERVALRKQLERADHDLRALHKELIDLAVTERRDKLHALLVSNYPDGVRIDSDELMDDFHTLSGLPVATKETMRQDLLDLCAKGRAWRKAIAASPKPGRVFVYGPLLAK